MGLDAGAEQPAGPVGGGRGRGDDGRAERVRVAGTGAGADPDQPPDAELDRLGEDRDRARGADPGRLNRQRATLRGLPVVAPEPAVVVAHPRLDEDVLGDRERPGRVAADQRVGRGRSARSQVEGHGGAKIVVGRGRDAPGPTIETLSLGRERSRQRVRSAPEAVGEALRSAVEKTLAATAESATGTRERAQELLDDVVRRGQSAREEVMRRRETATARLAEAIGELRTADRESLERIEERLAGIEGRIAALEGSGAESKPLPEVEDSPLEPDEQGDPRD